MSSQIVRIHICIHGMRAQILNLTEEHYFNDLSMAVILQSEFTSMNLLHQGVCKQLHKQIEKNIKKKTNLLNFSLKKIAQI